MEDNGFAEWGGYMDAKITKLEEQYSAASAPFRKSNLFCGISIFVNGLTNPSADELKRIMMVHGGTFHHYERKHTTYTIASNLPDVKVRNIDTTKIISPQWVVDCVKANRILDYTQYLLYTNRNTAQPSLGSFLKGKKDENKDAFVGQEPKAILPNRIGISDDSTLALKEESKYKSIDGNKSIKLKEIPKPICTETSIRPALKDESENKKHKINDTTKEASKLKSIKTVPNESNSALTAVNPNFLPEFYNNSRLHHIATLGAGFKQYISELREKHDENIGFPARLKMREKLLEKGFNLNTELNGSDATYIMHIDMDCFFVSVGLRKHPELRGLPIAVTHSKGGAGASDVPVHPSADREAEMELFAKRFEQKLHDNILSDKVRGGFNAKMSLAEIASCSYEARKSGIRNGMFVGQAMKLCPELKTIPYDFDDYKEVAFTLYNTVAQYTLQIEAVSCDEMYVDLSDVIKEIGVTPMEFVRFIRAEVREKTECPCSAGIGVNKLQARMATKRAKPDGQFHLKLEDVENYMMDIAVEDLPGVGSNTRYILKNVGVTKCSELRKLSEAKLQELVGKKFGKTLYQFCRGIDNRELAFEQLRKSVSAEVNYGIRFKEQSEVEKFLNQLCEEVHSRLCQLKRKTKCVTLKVMIRAKEAPVETSKFMGHGVCDHITKSLALNEFTNDVQVITNAVMSTMKKLKLPPNELRGIGIQLTKLDDQSAKGAKENNLKNMFTKMSKKRKDEDIRESVKETGAVQLSPSKEVRNVMDLVEMNDDRSKKNAPKKRPNVLSMLHDAQLKKRRTSTTEMEIQNERNATSSMELPSYIDIEVFDALPQEIREEILQDYKKTRSKQILHGQKTIAAAAAAPRSTSENSEALQLDELDDQPSTSHAAMERRKLLQNETNSRSDIKTDFNAGMCFSSFKNVPLMKPSAMNIFIQPHCNQLLLEWIKSDQVPAPYDINICRNHAIEMIRAQMYNDLYDPLSFLQRLIDSKHSLAESNPWGKAYCDILDAVQQEFSLMVSERQLYIPPKPQAYI